MFKNNSVPSDLDNAKSYSLKRHKLKSKKRLKLNIIILIIVLLSILYILSVTVLFKIEKIEIKGNNVYNYQQIYETSGIKENDNMFAINISSISAKLKLTFPYIQDVKIVRSIPDTLIFEIKEAKEKSAVKFDGKYVLLSEYNRILKIVDNELPEGVSLIYGIEVDNVIIGNYLKLDQGEKADALKSIYDSLNLFGIDVINYINIEDLNNISIKVDNSRTIYLGDSKNIEYKINMYHEININHLAKDEKFIINCKNPKRVVVNVDNN